MRHVLCLFLAVTVGCSGKPPVNREHALKSLTSQAEEVGQAMLAGDHAKMAQLTHAALVDKLGGRDNFIRQLEMITTDMKDRGFQFKAVTFSEPSDLVESSGKLYAVVPFKLELVAPGVTRGSQTSFLIGVSSDGGAGWRFVDGSGVAGDRSKLESILPEFPPELRLPAKQAPVFEKN